MRSFYPFIYFICNMKITDYLFQNKWEKFYHIYTDSLKLKIRVVVSNGLEFAHLVILTVLCCSLEFI